MKFLDFLASTTTPPKAFGVYHLICLAIMITLCALVVVFRKKFTDKSINIILLTTGITFIVLEIYKQVVMNYGPNGFGASYAWYIFPFQFCSTPMYLMLLAGILRKGKIHDCLISYLGTFALLAGLLVMLIPGDVLTYIIGINIQTMIVHGGMVVIGVLLLTTQKAKLQWFTIVKATIVFAVMVSIAMLLNTLWHFFGTNATFNMFFISPWQTCSLLPQLETLRANYPYILFFSVYFIGFTLAALLVLSIAIGIKALYNTINSKKKSS